MIGLAYALKSSVGAKPCQEGVFLSYSDPPPEHFGQRLKRLAKERGYTNRKLAELTGAHEVTVSKWMAGRVPEAESLAVLTELLHVSATELLRGAQKTSTGLPVEEGQERPVRAAKRPARKKKGER